MIYFVFCIHNHQPVGNFDSVIEEAYQDSYWPFLEAVFRHPSIKLSIHNSGFLLDWIADRHPEYIELLREMVGIGQVEVMGGGYYEPVLSVIPERDRLRQVTTLSDRVEELFGRRPRGIWLAERVWEPTHPSIIRKAGLEYLVVDDYHFVKAGLRKDELGGYYTTEDQGNLIKIFPGNEALRYLIPFKPAEDFERYMQGVRSGLFTRGNAAIYGDDGEKFGLWPGTRKWVFEDGWLERFFETIERNLDWIRPSTLGEYLDHEEPVGHTYLPNTSYMEMGEWALPTEASRAYKKLLEDLPAAGELGERARRFLQGGTWRNFLAKYPEANWMHKRMLMVSRELASAGLAEGAEAQKRLHKAQCNDAYWHGVFGGLYLPHLRTAVYENLILAENALKDGLAPGGVEISSFDLDADNHDEVVVRTSEMSLFLSPFNGGSLFELDCRRCGVNLLNTLTRYEEGYHYKLRAAADKGHSGHDARSIHDVVKVKEEGLERYLSYDRRRRASFTDHFLGQDLVLDDFRASVYKEEGEFCGGKYDAEIKAGSVAMRRTALAFGRETSVHKTFSPDGGGAFTVSYEVRGPGPASGYFGVELNILLPACDGPACRYEGEGLGSGGAGLGSEGASEGIRELRLVDSWKGVALSIGLSRPALLWRYPVYTVSLSEAGFEKIYQGSCLLFLYPAAAMRSGALEAAFRLAVEPL